ncbi:Lrp/AsnC family transcriptional regulator [Halomarina salina]|uniref:Lrp/AsnC family transcriptional regulator n=1 Tax=Halomarina salina TaxID=1872699 RepID=A0ABD5RJP5_9EURY|nr:Lrp/AsnC family transcriptional regulator [Halomarina salina]
MDERDVRLLRAITDLGTGSPEALHEETDIPVSTIHYRLNNLRDEGVITNDLYDIDLDAVGLDVTVVVEILADLDDRPAVEDEILAIEGVTHLFSTMGETDFIAIARLPDADQVGRLIDDFEHVDEVERTNSTFVIDSIREDSRALGSYEVETLLDALVDE